MEAIVLAGGMGTRLQSVIKDVPKSMAPVNNRPFLEFQFRYLKESGITRIILSVGYLADSITGYFGNSWNGIPVSYAFERTPLGTGGGIMNAMKHTQGKHVFVLNGDTMFRADLPAMYQFHLEKNSQVTLALRKVQDVSRYGAVTLRENKSVEAFHEKGISRGEGLINGGIYLMNRLFMLSQGFEEKFSIEKDFFDKAVTGDQLYGFESEAYFLDIGIPEDYKKAHDEFERF